MDFTDAQKTKRFELENKLDPLTPAERLLLAALNDLKEADQSGDSIKACEEVVKQAEKLLKDETKGTVTTVKKTVQVPEEIVPGGDDVRRVQLNQAK